MKACGISGAAGVWLALRKLAAQKWQ